MEFANLVPHIPRFSNPLPGTRGNNTGSHHVSIVPQSLNSSTGIMKLFFLKFNTDQSDNKLHKIKKRFNHGK